MRGSGALIWSRQAASARFFQGLRERVEHGWRAQVDTHLLVDVAAIIDEIGPRLRVYSLGRTKIVSDPEIRGGEEVFAGTRLPVRHVGGMRLNGASIHEILEDYPELTQEDVELARIYREANPPRGRPRLATAS